MKKILIFSLTYFPFVGGAEVAIREITGRIPVEEIEFHMVTLRFNSDLPRVEKVGNVMVHRIGWGRPGATTADLKTFPLHLLKHWYQCWAAFAAWRLHRQYRFGGVWAMMAHATGIPAGIFKTMHPRIPYLLTLQEGDPPEHIERLAWPVWPLFSRAFTEADAVQAISTFLGAWARRRHFTGPLEIIPNGVSVNRFTQLFPKEQLEGLRASIGKKAGETWLIHTGRFVHKNGLDTVVRALPLLPKHIHFFAIGDGPDKENLEALAKELGVSDRLHVHPYVPLDELPKYLAACDIFIRPSRSEGMGNSFIEAMAAGIPVIATQEGGIADFLFDARRNPDKEPTGWAVDKDSPEQIAKAVEDVLAHPEQVRAVTTNATELVMEQYDWNLIAEKMHALFNKVFV